MLCSKAVSQNFRTNGEVGRIRYLPEWKAPAGVPPKKMVRFLYKQVNMSRFAWQSRQSKILKKKKLILVNHQVSLFLFSVACRPQRKSAFYRSVEVVGFFQSQATLAYML